MMSASADGAAEELSAAGAAEELSAAGAAEELSAAGAAGAAEDDAAGAGAAGAQAARPTTMSRARSNAEILGINFILFPPWVFLMSTLYHSVWN
jgi:hypothetical protein